MPTPSPRACRPARRSTSHRLPTRSYPVVRELDEPECGLRTPFQRDRDRIDPLQGVQAAEGEDAGLCATERRPLPHTAHAHARGHAGSLATVARALALNEDLVEAIGLGHDMGHPPFGHIGEEALDDSV